VPKQPPATTVTHDVAAREADIVLRDGSTLHVRPVRPDDEPGLRTFFRGLSDQSRWFRFFGGGGEHFLTDAARRSAVVDGGTFSLIATGGPSADIVGQGLYVPTDGDHAEVALAVADAYQGRGLGTIFLAHLAEAAAANRVRIFDAEVLASNHRMLELVRESGFPVEVHPEPGQVRLTFPTSLTPEALSRFQAREQSAAANAIKLFFAPRSVAVIGASRRRGTVAGEVFHNLLSSGFPGPVYPVNRAASVVQSVTAYPSVESIPGPVDLAVVAVPADDVTATAEQCARKGVRALVVLSAGFAEVGDVGRRRQADLLGICRAAGMRLIGPNCMGLLNTDPAAPLNATFAPGMPPTGRIGFLSQSGALGLAIIDRANALGLGLSTFVSVGNKADISGNDLLQYWQTDPRTDVILLYLESFGNPRKFSRIARGIGRTKPIVAVKSGRSRAGSRAASSHTGALVASSDVSVEALFRQCGVIRTDTLAELFDVASLLAHQPVPKGRRVGIVTNAGGPAILCADACEGEGLEVPVLTAASQAALRALLPAQASVTNPVDMIAAATAEQYQATIDIVARDPNVDALVVIYIPPVVTRPEDVARAIVAGVVTVKRKRVDKPVLAVFMSAAGVPDALRTSDVGIPSYPFPENAAIALARAARYGEWRARPDGTRPEFADIRRDEAAALIARALARGEGWLSPDELNTLLTCYGVPMVETRIVANAEQAEVAARDMAATVALKAIAPALVHKTEAGAVRLGLADAQAVRLAAEDMAVRLGGAGHEPTGFVVQRMVPGGVEMLIGIAEDPQFGSLVVCGAGGTLVELLHDVAVRLTPLTAEDASEMLRSLKSYPLLTGFRGAPRRDVAGLENVLLRIGALAEDLPAIAELDLNPVIVGERGALVVDARARVKRPAAGLPTGALG
jgi:acetyl coenzyme A synthetase (ADP forming)-like protein